MGTRTGAACQNHLGPHVTRERPRTSELLGRPGSGRCGGRDRRGRGLGSGGGASALGGGYRPLVWSHRQLPWLALREPLAAWPLRLGLRLQDGTRPGAGG